MARASRVPVNAEPDKQATLAASRVDRDAARDIQDAGGLRELLIFGQGLAAWAAQFDPKSYATLLAAGAVGVHGIDRLLAFVDDTLLRLAPYSPREASEQPCDSRDNVDGTSETEGGGGSNQSVWSSDWRDAQRQLCRTLNTFRFLREHVAGHLRAEPELRYPYDESPDSVPWSWTWEPADEETAIVAQAWFLQFPKHELLRGGVAEAQRIHDRIARHARQEVRHLIAQMQAGTSYEGFPRARTAIDALTPGKKRARAKAALRIFERSMLGLADLVPEPASGDPTPFGRPHQEFLVVPLIVKFIEAGRNYIAECLPLLEQKRGSLQARRKKIARWFAIVAQYAFLASSNGRFRRFAELVAAVDVFSRYLKEDVTALLDAVMAKSQASDEQVRSIVQTMNALVVEPQVLGRWEAALEGTGSKKGASYYGTVIGVIVEGGDKQATPWERGDVLPSLSRAGLITAKVQRKKIDAVTDICFAMQQVGLAVQVPFDHLLGEADPPAKQSGKREAPLPRDGLPWIVNPLGVVLAYPKPAGAVVPLRGRRGKHPAKETTTGGLKKSKSARRRHAPKAKPGKRGASRDTSLPKAAKKWPRA